MKTLRLKSEKGEGGPDEADFFHTAKIGNFKVLESEITKF